MANSSITPKRYSFHTLQGILPANKIPPNAIHLFADESLVSQCSDVVQIQRRAPHMVAQRIRQFVIAITDNIGNPICGSDVE